MENKVVTLTNKANESIYLYCTKVYEGIDGFIVLELDKEKNPDSLLAYMEVADTYSARYMYNQENRVVILGVYPEMITEISAQ